MEKGLTLGTAACRLKPEMSLSVALVAVRVTVSAVPVGLSHCSFRVTPFLSYTVTLAASKKTQIQMCYT